MTNGGESDVMRIFRQHVPGSSACFCNALCLQRLCPEIAQCCETPLSDDATGHFATSTEDPANRREISPKRAVGEGEVSFFVPQASIDHIKEVLRPRSLTGREDALPHRTHRVPDLVPALSPRPA